MASGSWGVITIMMFCINIFMYIGLGTSGSYLFDGDLLSQYVVMNINKTNEGLMQPGASQQINFTSDIAAVPSASPLTSIPGISIVSIILDGLDIVFDFIKIIFNVLFAPLALFSIANVPVFVKVLMIPYSLTFLIGIVQLIRGAS